MEGDGHSFLKGPAGAKYERSCSAGCVLCWKPHWAQGFLTLLWHKSFSNKHINHFISKRSTADSHFHSRVVFWWLHLTASTMTSFKPPDLWLCDAVFALLPALRLTGFMETPRKKIRLDLNLCHFCFCLWQIGSLSSTATCGFYRLF